MRQWESLLNDMKEVAELMAKEYSWSEHKKEEEIRVYLDYIKNSVLFIK